MYKYLERKVNKSKKFDKYFEKNYCKLKSRGAGDTYHTLNVMMAATYEFRDQTNNLVKDNYFQTSSLRNLTKIIASFAYNYIQYRADGFEQHIKSPYCAYATRFDGLDCKSYSLFVGTMLLNLGVNFYYRKIQQFGDEQGKFSHVYVIIPINQQTNNLKNGYYVIDGTVNNQNEINYINSKKVFMQADKMPHYTLNGVKKNKSQNKFDILLNFLQNKGYEQASLINLRNTVNHFTEKGINPTIYKAKNRYGVFIENVFVELVNKSTDDYKLSESPIKDTSKKLKFSSEVGLKGFGDGEYDFGDWNDSGETSSTDSEDGGNGGDYEWVDEVWSFIQTVDWDNVFNFDCWGGSSWDQGSYDQHTQGLKTFFTAKFNELKTANINDKSLIENKINQLSIQLQSAKDNYLNSGSGLNSCSNDVIDAIESYANSYLENFKNTVIPSIENHYSVQETSINVNYDVSMLTYGYGHAITKSGTITATRYNLTDNNQGNNQDNNQEDNNQGNNQDNNQDNNQGKSSSLPIGIGLLVVAKLLLS